MTMLKPAGSGVSVLLIGGSGFMGATTARVLAEAGHRVTVLSRLQRSVAHAQEVLVADRHEDAVLARALEDRHFDFTVDFLAYDSADVERLLLVPFGSLGRIVMISTGQVYLVTEGNPPYREEDRDLPLGDEPAAETPDHAAWAYGMGKRRAEQTLRTLSASHGVRATALRLPIVLGEGDGTLRLWGWLERMLDGGPILLPEGGERPVRFVWSEDVARALLRLLEGPAPRVFAYNLAQPDVLPLREFLERVAAAAGVTPRFVDVSWAEIEAAGLARSAFPYAGRWVSVLDPSLAAAELGLACTRLEDYLPRVVRALVEHRPAQSDEGYALRARELELAARTAGSVP